MSPRYRRKLALLGAAPRREVARLQAALDHLAAELARANAAAAEARNAEAAASTAAGRARARVLEAREIELTLRRELDQAHADVRIAAGEAVAERALLARAGADAAELRAGLDRLLASTSWRVTAPLRGVMRAVPGPLRRLARRMLRAPRPELPPPPAPPAPPPPAPDPYAAWIAANEPPSFTQIGNRPRPPLTLLLPNPGTRMKATLDSLLRQEGAEWTLLAPDTPAARAATEAMRHDRRLLLVPCTPELDRGGTLAALLERVEGAWFAVIDDGDVLAPAALHILAAAAASDPGAALIYGDEDEADLEGNRSAPQLKPGWSPELLLRWNYVGRPALLSRAAALDAGGFRPETGAAAEWDLHLRLGATRPVRHVPAVLCHRPAGHDADRPAPGTAASAQLRRVLLDHWATLGRDQATAVTLDDGTFRSSWDAPAPQLVSVVVPATGDADALRRCLARMRDDTSFPRIELVLASTGPATDTLHAELKLLGDVSVVEAPAPIGLFAALDQGARHARGDMLLFLDPAHVPGVDGWLPELVRIAGLTGVGAAGPAEATGNVAALPWSCLMVRREAFIQAGGFGDGGGDAEFCLRLAQLGWRIATSPFAGAAAGPMPRAAPDAAFLLFDDAAIVAATGLPRRFAIPEVAAGQPIEDAAAAARWVIALLRARADLRVRFPRAVSDGEAGAFAAFLAEGDGVPVPSQLRDHLPAMWRAGFADRPRQAYAWRDDVREAHPAGLLPPGMAGFLRYLVRDGAVEYGLRLEETWWFLLAAAERPAAELVTAYRFNRDWQRRHPLALTVFGAPAFAAWIASRYGAGGSAAWLDPAAWPGLPDAAAQLRLAWAALPGLRARHPASPVTPDTAAAVLLDLSSSASDQSVRAWAAAQQSSWCAAPAVNVIGHFCYPSGLRVSVEAITAAMETAGIGVHRRDVRTHLEDCTGHTDFGALESGDVTILHIQPGDLFLKAYERADLLPRDPRTYRIGYWYWELEEVPPHWRDIARETDELWVATPFIAEGLRKVVDVPVHVLFPGVRLGPFTPRPREALGVPPRGRAGAGGERFAFLFSFHMASIVERKNPFGLIRAFRRAFSADEPVDLVLKTTSEPRHAGEMAALRRAAEGANVTIIDAVFGPEDTLALMQACDAYVSLHRSEGLGLTMAEAMLLGKPVIGTRYSGNLAFMSDENSLLVDAGMVPVGPDTPPYDPASLWAAPSEEHAARLMRRLALNPAEAAALGRAAQRSAQDLLSPHAAGLRMARRLREIADAPSGLR